MDKNLEISKSTSEEPIEKKEKLISISELYKLAFGDKVWYEEDDDDDADCFCD